MSKPQISEADIHAWLDGQLAAARHAEVESHLASEPEDAARFAAYREQDDALRARFDTVLDEPVPKHLLRSNARRGPGALRYAAAIGWIVLGGLAGWHLHERVTTDSNSDAPAWAHRAAVAHIVYSPEVRHPVEVGADQEAHLVAWLSKRLGAQLKIPSLTSLGYSLVGGRLLPGDAGPVAQFMFQDAQGQRLTLYVRRNADQARETAFRFSQDGNVRVFYWIDRGLGLALSGEIEKSELLRVATAVYQQLNP
jgi:anti-sigma factor RsiW